MADDGHELPDYKQVGGEDDDRLRVMSIWQWSSWKWYHSPAPLAKELGADMARRCS